MPDLSSVKNTLQNLKTTIVRTKTKDVDAKLDKAVTDIIAYKSGSGRNGYIDLVKSLISKTADVKLSTTGGGLFGHGLTPAAFGQGSRLMRYKTYQAIVSQINWAYRALNVLVDNILSPDDITKTVLEIKPKAQLEDETPTASRTSYIKDIVKKLNIEENLTTIVKNTLLYGDLFCEIGGPVEALTSRTLLFESELYEDRFNEDLQSGFKQKIIETIDKKDYEFIMDYSYLKEETKDSKKKKSKDNKELKNLKLIYHNPQGRL